MNTTADLRLPFAVRPLTPRLGAELSGVVLADDATIATSQIAPLDVLRVAYA